ncbi:MAG TPA: ATP/GTP-binding protein [Nitrososphaerales archaeon]|nr:ATP/GTP-binding protein [Nitrososphaerales archaeon]
MRAIFLTGTAGSGKSMLCSALLQWFSDKGSSIASVNLDPGAQSLPYEPDVDIRDFVDLSTVMQNYQLGPNGALILAADLIATKINEIQEALDSLNTDYAILDTPGQIELFAYRTSGPYIVENLQSEGKTVLFLFDSILSSTPTNFVSLALLASSVQLRLKAPQIPVLSRRDLLGSNLNRVLSWAGNSAKLEAALREESGDSYELIFGLLRSLVRSGMSYELLPVSATTREGMLELSATIARQLNLGEENED